MNYLEICSLLQIAKQDTVGYSDVARAVGVERQHIAKIKSQEVEEEKLLKIEKYFNVTLPRNFVISNAPKDEEGSAEGKIYKIPYWEGCHTGEFKDLLLKDGVSECMMDYQVLVNDWGCVPENLRILAMPGEEMDGGAYPLKNQDLLIIDVGRTNTIESGVFVATSHGGSRVYVRRVIERMSFDFAYLTTVDNPRWEEYVTKKWTMEQWKDADIQIIGRVIKNMSLKI